jgi:hypothetical protein
MSLGSQVNGKENAGRMVKPLTYPHPSGFGCPNFYPVLSRENNTAWGDLVSEIFTVKTKGGRLRLGSYITEV